MNTLSHILVVLLALVIVLAGYCVLVLNGSGDPKFLEAAVVGLAGAIAGLAKNSA